MSQSLEFGFCKVFLGIPPKTDPALPKQSVYSLRRCGYGEGVEVEERRLK
jgi:hypothetical protein